MKRTDIHSPGNIVPGEYEYRLSYCSLNDEPPVNVKEALVYYHGKFFGRNIWNCSICGASFKTGDIWEHVPTGTYISIGWQCAEKYDMLADRDEFRGLKAIVLEKERKRQEREKFVRKNPDMDDIFENENYIIRDIVSKIEKGWKISDKQIALMRRIKAQQAIAVEIPEGRLKVVGTIVSVKEKFLYDKFTYRMTVKIRENGCEWHCHGTVPKKLIDEYYNRAETSVYLEKWLKGKKISFTATFERGREKGFAFFKRPK